MATILEQLLDTLESTHGKVPNSGPTATHTDPLALILWENVAYLVDDARRGRAFKELKNRIGLRAQEIAQASDEDLLAVAELGGMHPHTRVTKLRTIVETVLEHADGDLKSTIQDIPLPQARKLLKRFPGIGDPGADKILLFTGIEPLLAMDSNVLRVLLRLGFGQEAKSYSTTYKSAQRAAENELSRKRAPRVRAFHLLRRHGQEICKNNRPLCDECVIQGHCAYFRSANPA